MSPGPRNFDDTLQRQMQFNVVFKGRHVLTEVVKCRMKLSIILMAGFRHNSNRVISEVQFFEASVANDAM